MDNKNNNKNNNKKGMVLRYTMLTMAAVLVVILIWSLLGNKPPEQKAYQGTEDSLVQMLDNELVSAVYVVNGYTAYVLKVGSTVDVAKFYKNPKGYADYIVHLPSRMDFDNYLLKLEGKVPTVKYNDPSARNWTSYLLPIALVLLMGVSMFIIFKQAGGANKQAMNFGKTKARLNTNVKVKFADVAGAEEEKAELQEIVDFLKNPQKFTHLGARIPKGVLLVGPPGTGKTLFAKAVAGESNVPFFTISGSDFVEMFVGTGAARVRDLFEQAKRNMPCIIFIDEIDAVGRQRGAGLGGGNDEREQTLNQLLVQMDGFDKNDGIIIIAATNRVDILDPALLRPGRFDRQIYVNIPDVKGREAILRVHSRNKPIAPDVSYKVLARMTSGFSGADLENLLNESAILAARDNRKVIIMEDLLEGINKVIAGPQKNSRVITNTDKRITAYHEAGHAIIAKLSHNCDEVQEVSIIPRGMAAGYTLTRPDNDDSHITKNKLTDMIVMLLGGRAAEKIIIHDISTGASNDIERATSIARSMVTEWGMADSIGNMFLGGGKEVFLGKDYGAQQMYSEQLGGIIDTEIKKILDECYAKAIDMLQQNRTIMENMVKVLFAKNTIYTEEVNMLFDNKSAQEVIDYIDNRVERKNIYKKDENAMSNGIAIVPETEVVVDAPNTQNESQETKQENTTEIADTTTAVTENVESAEEVQENKSKATAPNKKTAKPKKPEDKVD